MIPDSTQLIVAALNGDEIAARHLVDLHYCSIYNFLRRLTRHDDDASDLTQRTFARAWSSLKSFAGRSTVSSWLHGIAWHTYLDWRRAHRPPVDQSATWWESQVISGPGPAETAAASDLAASLYAAVETLEPEVRATVHLHYFQDLSLAETAEALGVAASTVKYRLRQGLHRLQIILMEKASLKPLSSPLQS